MTHERYISPCEYYEAYTIYTCLVFPPASLQVHSEALCEQHREFLALLFGRTFTSSTLRSDIPFLPPSRPGLIPLSFAMVVSRESQSQCAPDAPSAPPNTTPST